MDNRSEDIKEEKEQPGDILPKYTKEEVKKEQFVDILPKAEPVEIKVKKETTGDILPKLPPKTKEEEEAAENKFGVEKIFVGAWELFAKKWWQILIVSFLWQAFAFGANYIIQPFGAEAGQGYIKTAIIGVWLMSVCLTIPWFSFFFKYVTTDRLSLKNFIPSLGSAVKTVIFLTVISFFGYIFLNNILMQAYIPVIIISVLFLLIPFIFIIIGYFNNESFFGSIKDAFSLLSENFIKIMFIWFLLMVINKAASMLVIGTIFTAPYAMILMIYTYFGLKVERMYADVLTEREEY